MRAVLSLALISIALFAQTPRRGQNVLQEGRALLDKSDPASLHLAVQRFTEALELFRAEGEPALEVEAVGGRADALDRLGEYDASLRDYRDAEERYRRLGDHVNEVMAIAGGADVEREQKHVEASLQDCARAVKVAQAAGDRSGEAYANYCLGMGWITQGDTTQALGGFSRAAEIYGALKDALPHARVLYYRGAMLDRLDKFEEAAASYRAALPALREKHEDLLLAMTLNNLGADYRRLSRYKEALDCFTESAPLRIALGDRYGEALTLMNMGTVYNALDNYPQAVEQETRAVALFKELDKPLEHAIALNNLGAAYDAQQQDSKALECYLQALDLLRQVKDRAREGGALNNIGKAYAGLGDLPKAISYYEQALTLAAQEHDAQSLGIGLSNLGASYSRLGKYEQAVSYLDRALLVLRTLKDRRAEARALSNLMDASDARGRPRLAILYGKQSVNLFQSIRSDIAGLSAELQRSYVEGNEATYRKLSDLLIAQGRLAEAERTLDLLKLEEFFAFVRGDAKAAGPAGAIELTPEERQWAQDSDGYLLAIGQRRGELMAKMESAPLTSDEEAQLSRLDAQLKAGNAQFQQYLEKLGSETTGQPEAARVSELREAGGLRRTLRKLKHGAVAVYTLVGADKYRAILVTPDVEKAYEYTISKADLNRQILEFRRAVEARNIDPRPAARKLYDVLIGPKMREDLRQAKAETLMWSLDGALRYVPLAALYDGRQYLIEQFRLEVFTPESQDTFTDRPAKQWTAAAFGVTKAHPDFAALPGVADELRGIVRAPGQTGGPMNGELLLDERFTEASLESALRQNYSVIHIASHFSFTPGDETNSFLLLGDGAHLTLAELKTLPPSRDFDLLTLSACNTGLSGSAQGKEVDGLAVLAQRQGAKAVLASLWEVSDESTSLLMRTFYELRESHADMTKGEALRQAQLRMLHGETTARVTSAPGRGVSREPKPGQAAADLPPFQPDPQAPLAHPYYWASFFLIGNWL